MIPVAIEDKLLGFHPHMASWDDLSQKRRMTQEMSPLSPAATSQTKTPSAVIGVLIHIQGLEEPSKSGSPTTFPDRRQTEKAEDAISLDWQESLARHTDPKPSPLHEEPEVTTEQESISLPNTKVSEGPTNAESMTRAIDPVEDLRGRQ